VAEPLANSRHYPDDRSLLLENEQRWGSAPCVRASRLVLRLLSDSIRARADRLRRRHNRGATDARKCRARDVLRIGHLRGSDTGVPDSLLGGPVCLTRQEDYRDFKLIFDFVSRFYPIFFPF